MKAQDAYNSLQPDKWASTPLNQRLNILKQLQKNLTAYAKQLSDSDQKMRNDIVGQPVYQTGLGMYGTAGPIGGAIDSTIDLYQSIAKGNMLKAKTVTQVNDTIYDLEVWPQTTKDKLLAAKQRGHLRVKGTPRQVNPFDKPSGVIAVLGAGNYSSALEMVKALFWENKAVIHKPHHLNETTDAIWAKVFEPLSSIGAIAFCDADQGRELTAVTGLTAIYFTGGTSSAKAILAATSTPLMSECGGNNPCIVVPGDRPWTDKEIEHQALQFVSLAKINGGAVCGRAQTLVTSKHWAQRDQFLDAVRKAFTDGTPAISMYYPGTDTVKERFHQEYPDAEVLPAEQGKYPHSDTLFITGASVNSFATQNESFCLVNAEVPLDVPADAESFLPAAVAFCNDTLLGSLACMVVIDEDTKKAHQAALDTAITNLSYGGIAINTIPPLVFANPYLTWGGNEEGKEMVSGSGNFGNLLCYENVEKSIISDTFIASTHFLYTKKRPFDELMGANARYIASPTWPNMARLMTTAVRTNLAKKDF